MGSFTDIEVELDGFVEESEPVENESDLEGLLLAELSASIIQSTDWTTGTIIDQVRKERIQLNPRFQRRDAWDDDRKSKFIESLLLGFPIPQLVLAESQTQRGRYLIIDGKQRMLSLMQFAGSQEEDTPGAFRVLRLKGLRILDQLNGKTYADLHSSRAITPGLEDFENRTIRTVVIRHWKSEAVLYHIFLRLNTGSVQLSPQELRNALHPGAFAEFVDTYAAESKGLRRILHINRPDFRMRDAELLLRYYGFRNFLSDYAGSMKRFLDDTTKTLNDNWEQIEPLLYQQAAEFEEAVNLAYEVFGDDAFRKWKEGMFLGRFNRAIYDAIIFHFCNPRLQAGVREKSTEIKKAFIELSEAEPKFVDAVEATTKSLDATVTRLALWTQALEKVLNCGLVVPQLIKNRII